MTTETQERTITVTGMFGKPKEVTAEKFVRLWLDHARELEAIGMFIVDDAVVAASKEFNYRYELQQQKRNS